MAPMMGGLYSALRKADIPEEASRKAAEEVASYENRLLNLESRLTVLTWMIGLNSALMLGVFWTVLTL